MASLIRKSDGILWIFYLLWFSFFLSFVTSVLVEQESKEKMQKSTTTLYSDFASSQTKFVFYTFTVCLLCFHHICKIPVISILSAQCVQICYPGVFPIISLKKNLYTKRQNRIIKMIQIFA